MSARLQRLAWGVVILATPLASVSVPAQEISLSSSFGYASGSYIFAEQYRSMSLLTSLSVRAGSLQWSASIPVLAQNGTSVSLIAGVPIPTGGPDAGAVQRRQQGETIPVRPGRNGRGSFGPGISASLALAAASLADSAVAAPGDYEVNLGDPMLGGSLAVFEGIGVLRAVEVEGWAKVPVASVSSGVGTGEWDYGLGGSIALRAGEVMMFAGATWWIIGDMADLILNDALFYSASIGRSLGVEWSALASVSAASRIIESVDPPVSVTLSLSRRLSSGMIFHVGAGAGLTESAPSFTTNIGVSRRWSRASN